LDRSLFKSFDINQELRIDAFMHMMYNAQVTKLMSFPNKLRTTTL